MSSDPIPTLETIALPAPTRRKPSRRGAWVVLVLLIATPAGLWAAGVRPQRLWASPPPRLDLVRIDRGVVSQEVIEGGSLESSNNATSRCQVEALMGQVGGNMGNTGGRGGTGGQGMGNRGMGGQGMGGQNMGGMQPAQATRPVAKKGAGAAKKAGATSKTAGGGTAGSGGAAGAAGGASGGAAGGGAAGGGAAGGGAAGGGGGMSGGAGGGGMGGGSTVAAPVIKSFEMVVMPHTPLRVNTPAANQAMTKNQGNNMMGGQGQGQGGRGGGGGGRGGGQGGMDERPGATRILSILTEGTPVKAGDVVCELDSAAFTDELQAQLIRHAQAKAYVDQAQSILRVSELALTEYKDGIYPQDLQQLDLYIQACITDRDQKRLDLEFGRKMAEHGAQTAAQLKASEAALQAADIRLSVAHAQKRRLVQYTRPKLLKQLQAKVEAVRTDLLAQKEVFQREDDRKRRLEKMIANCTMRAPRDGIVVYAQAANPWGRVELQIREGVTVREGQAIFNLPDPKHMRVRVRVNESKLDFVNRFLASGGPTDIRVDAFPDRPMHGRITEVTAIPAPANGPVSDIKVYYAMVEILGEEAVELKPGLSARVTFHGRRKDDVIRVPVRALRWSEEAPFVAVPAIGGFAWRPVQLGLIGTTYAEVVSGLDPGEQVVADPGTLPPPPREERPRAAAAQAGAATAGRAG